MALEQKLLAKLKIVSGMLGIRLDDLRQRNMQRRRRNWILASVSTAVMLAITGSSLDFAREWMSSSDMPSPR